MRRFNSIKMVIGMVAAGVCMMVFQNCGDVDANKEAHLESFSQLEDSVGISATHNFDLNFTFEGIVFRGEENPTCWVSTKIVPEESFSYNGLTIWMWVDGRYVGGMRQSIFGSRGSITIEADEPFGASVLCQDLLKFSSLDLTKAGDVKVKVAFYDSYTNFRGDVRYVTSGVSNTVSYDPENPVIIVPGETPEAALPQPTRVNGAWLSEDQVIVTYDLARDGNVIVENYKVYANGVYITTKKGMGSKRTRSFTVSRAEFESKGVASGAVDIHLTSAHNERESVPSNTFVLDLGEDDSDEESSNPEGPSSQPLSSIPANIQFTNSEFGAVLMKINLEGTPTACKVPVENLREVQTNNDQHAVLLQAWDGLLDCP